MKHSGIRSNTSLLFLAVCVAVIVLYLGYLWADSLRGPRLEELCAEDIESIQFLCCNLDFTNKQAVTCADRTLIREFVALLQTAIVGTPHKCASPILITINFKNKKPYLFDSLPGHNEDYYEFGMRQVHRVARQPYIKLLEKIGLKQVPTKCG